MVRKFNRICEIIHEYNGDKSKLVPILQAVQEEYRYLPKEIMAFVAMKLGLSAAQVYGVASFYAHFALEPKGKYIIRICNGTACHVKGSMGLHGALSERLGLSGEKTTTDDMMFTLETVSCLGACGLAPVMTVNDAVYGQLTPEKAVKIIDEIMSKEEACATSAETV
jgi:NADH-quinone oxidoreductase subunit E